MSKIEKILNEYKEDLKQREKERESISMKKMKKKLLLLLHAKFNHKKIGTRNKAIDELNWCEENEREKEN